MDWIWLVVVIGTSTCVALDRLASRAIKRSLQTSICEHQDKQTSYITNVQRCLNCGAITNWRDL